MKPPGRLFTLRDGTQILLRRIRPDDKERLQSGLEQLSPESRHRRFLSVPERFSSTELKYLTEVDQVDHLAWVALDPTREGEPGVGVARCVRLPEQPSVAEVAVTVLDSHQGLGVGPALLGVLSQAALEAGIRVFRAFVLATNTTVLEILERHGATLGEREGTARWFDVPVPEPVPDRLGDVSQTPAGRAFLELAEAEQRDRP